jgi:hypothetical protein
MPGADSELDQGPTRIQVCLLLPEGDAPKTRRRPMSRLRLLMAVAMLGTVLALPVSASAAPPAASYQLPITGTVVGGGTFNGTLDITRFAVQNGQLTALGTISGTLTDAANVAHQVTDFAVALPVNLLDPATAASCDILNLVLGPLHLNLLGLEVDLNQVVLNVTAVPGAGNLLGNLLCAVAGLLDGGVGGALNGLAALLNQILVILG